MCGAAFDLGLRFHGFAELLPRLSFVNSCSGLVFSAITLTIAAVFRVTAVVLKNPNNCQTCVTSQCTSVLASWEVLVPKLPKGWTGLVPELLRSKAFGLKRMP